MGTVVIHIIRERLLTLRIDDNPILISKFKAFVNIHRAGAKFENFLQRSYFLPRMVNFCELLCEVLKSSVPEVTTNGPK